MTKTRKNLMLATVLAAALSTFGLFAEDTALQILSGTPSDADATCYTVIGSDPITGFSSKWKPFTANVLIDPTTGRTIVTWKNGEYNVGKRELDIGPVEKKLLVEVPPFAENKPMWFNSFTVRQWNGKRVPGALLLIFR